MTSIPTPGLTADDLRIRRIVADVVSTTLAIAIERSGEGKSSLVGHWLAQLDIVARTPDPPQRLNRRPKKDGDLEELIAEAKRVSRLQLDTNVGLLIDALAHCLEDEMLDTHFLREQRAGMSDKASDAVITAFETYERTLHGKTPEDAHPCEACLDALRQDVVIAVTEALR
jgi:hypothetical protein